VAFLDHVQVANQPGLEDVLADLLEYEQRESDDTDTGAEFYTLACPTHLKGSYRQPLDVSTALPHCQPHQLLSL